MMDYKQTQHQMDQLRRDMNAAADRIRELAESLEDLASDLPLIQKETPGKSIADKCVDCNFYTRDGRCLFMIGCAKK